MNDMVFSSGRSSHDMDLPLVGGNIDLHDGVAAEIAAAAYDNE